ncbi:hypothetical protein GCM10027341_32770 [Spirosoma knui]
MNAVDYHSAIAQKFASRYESSAAFQERYRVWTALFNQYIASGTHVLDLGCGSGVFSRYLAEKGCLVTGIDGSETMISLCEQQKMSSTLQYYVEPIPLENAKVYMSQDAIVASSLLEYIDEMPAVLRQIDQMLKPGGLLLVSMPNRQSLYRRMEWLLFQLTGYPRYFAHLRSVSTAALLNQQMTELGFEVLDVAYFSGTDPLSTLLKRLLPKEYVNNLFVSVYRKL